MFFPNEFSVECQKHHNILLILSRNHIKRFEAKTIKAAKKRRAAKALLTLLANDLQQHLYIIVCFPTR